MSFLDFTKDRHSVRGYTNRIIEPEKLADILEAGRIAPTANNNQPHRIKVITGPADLSKVDECTPCRFGASTVLLVCYDKSISWKRNFDGADSGAIDASIVTTYLMLAAHEAGLGSCWVMYFDPAKTSELFALPENVVPMAFLPIGYPAKDAVPTQPYDQRFALEQILL
ncbi:MAG: nitroreductase family protein [Oscillospiraceae bacterium]|jgi:nitroreductase|nr:nitroreductase family protein [Oscillospiraceae bacterium]